MYPFLLIEVPIRVLETHQAPFGINSYTIQDGEHIIYVNGSLRAKNTALGKLMSDFFCTEAKDMCYKELSDRVRQYKETEKGVDGMCDILDEMKNDIRIETAQKMLKDGKLTMEKIAEYSGLSLEKVRELAGNKSA